MTPIQKSAAETAQRLANELRLTIARLLTLPAPQCDDAAIAMRGAEMTADALVRLLGGKQWQKRELNYPPIPDGSSEPILNIPSGVYEINGKRMKIDAPVIDVEPIVERPLDSKEYIPDAETLLP